MASINLEKFTLKELTAMSVHFDQGKRETLNHANKDIDKSLSADNYTIETVSYKASIDMLKARTDAVDKLIPPKRVKKDRVVCDMAYIVCPQELTDKDLSKEFFEESYKWFREYFGKDNIHGGFVHVDEVHEYNDFRSNEKKMSLEHMHIMISPYTAEKGINSKAFNNKIMYKDLQTKFDEWVHETYGVYYQTGEHALGLKVEELKEATKKIDEKLQKLEELDQQIETKGTDLDMLDQVYAEYGELSDIDKMLKIAELKKENELLKRQLNRNNSLLEQYRALLKAFKEKVDKYISNLVKWLTGQNMSNHATIAKQVADNHFKDVNNQVSSLDAETEKLKKELELGSLDHKITVNSIEK